MEKNQEENAILSVEDVLGILFMFQERYAAHAVMEDLRV